MRGREERHAAQLTAGEDLAQGTLEYALTVLALLSIVLALAALMRAGEAGTLASALEQACPRQLNGTGALDVALF